MGQVFSYNRLIDQKTLQYVKKTNRKMAVIFCLLPLLESEIKYYTTYKITYLLRNLTTNTTIPTYML